MRHAVADPQCSDRISNRSRVVFTGAGYTETNADKARAGRSSVENENRAAVDRAFWPGKTELPVEGKNSGRVPNGREYSWVGTTSSPLKR
jgi:hypothetical protein